MQWLYPEVRSVWNSAIAFSLNDGAMWAGHGASVLVRAGVRAGFGPVQIVLAPELTYSENRPFEVLPGREPGRSTYSSPWHIGTESADLPLRLGDQPWRIVGLGQSSLTVSTGPVAVGASTENQWWGPGIRNAIVMSNNAPGIPHLFLRTTRPLRTPLGALEARWIIGGLTESLYFDTLASNDLRSLSGLVMTLRPGGARGLTVGVARTVYGEAGSTGVVIGRLF
ncbi:MAG: capsule assembly Wzi family protein, partial [Dehalococcoidia bacterium]|nr:capsule assembly Wzi family protein [Dehalococcoidia bacterium]